MRGAASANARSSARAEILATRTRIFPERDSTKSGSTPKRVMVGPWAISTTWAGAPKEANVSSIRVARSWSRLDCWANGVAGSRIWSIWGSFQGSGVVGERVDGAAGDSAPAAGSAGSPLAMGSAGFSVLRVPRPRRAGAVLSGSGRKSLGISPGASPAEKYGPSSVRAALARGLAVVLVRSAVSCALAMAVWVWFSSLGRLRSKANTMAMISQASIKMTAPGVPRVVTSKLRKNIPT